MSSQILKIDKVTILLMTTPVFHPDNPEGGIRLSNAKAEAVVDPWLNMNAFDTAELLLNNESTPVADKTIQPGEENKRFSLFLPIARLHDGINRIRLRVKRISQDPETSEDLVVLFNTHRPGGDVTGTGDNLNLVMTLPADCHRQRSGCRSSRRRRRGQTEVRLHASARQNHARL